MILPAISQLPELSAYRAAFEKDGVGVPVRELPWWPEGALRKLPRVDVVRTGWPWDVQTEPFAAGREGWPLITIVTPSYQQGRYLEETLRSLLLQNYPRLEVLVFDAGSTDETIAILDAYRPFLSLVRVGRDRGQSHAINMGLSLASGDILSWLNSDDFLMPGTLRRVAEVLRTGRVDVVYGDLGELDEDKALLSYRPAKCVHASFRRYGGLIYQSSCFWVRRVSLPVLEELNCAMDYDLWVRMLPGARLKYLSGMLSVARLHSEAKTHATKMKDSWQLDAVLNGQNYPALYRAQPVHAWVYRVCQAMAYRVRIRRAAAFLRQVAVLFPRLQMEKS